MIREYQPGDHVAIAEIFTRAIHEIASEVYTPEQCFAWSDRKPDPEHWEKRCALKRPFVAVMNGRIAGFLELDPDGHIDCAYTSPDFARRGVMTRLVKQAVGRAFDSGVRRVHVEASICAAPMFAKCGFRVIEENTVDIGGVKLVNYQMELLEKPPDQFPPSAGS